MRAVVLTYHGINIHGNDYADNDHVALAEDLHLLRRLAIPVLPLHGIVDALDGRAPLPPRCVALSFDDGAWFDWHDLEHPSHGMQRSLANVMRDACRPGEWLHATSFVIAGPQPRETLDRTCMVGRGWWTDDWWPAAIDSGLLSIENHSWDHHHDLLPERVTGQPGGRFDTIGDIAAADAEIAAASDYLDQRLPQRRTRLFAYPYGHVNDFLRREYFPQQRARHRLDAAFTTEPQPLSPGCDRWALGRYVCGFHWRSPEQLTHLLRDALG